MCSLVAERNRGEGEPEMWVRAEVKAGRRRIALVAPTAADARNVMVEGASGILAISPDPERPHRGMARER